MRKKKNSKKYCKEAILFNLIFTKLDNKYNSIETLKDKKSYLKELLRKSDTSKKGMLIKFINDKNTFILIDIMKDCFLNNNTNMFYSVCCYELFKDFHYRNDEMKVKEVLKHLFYQYIKNNSQCYKEYFEWVKVVQWVHNKLNEMCEPP